MPVAQPRNVKPGCVLVVHTASGCALTVHQTRLYPAELPAVVTKPKSACLKCGRVAGVIEDRVTCPEHGKADCGMVTATVEQGQ